MGIDIGSRISCTNESDWRIAAGKLHFVKFETAKIDSAMSFIRENCLHMSHRGDDEVTDVVRIKATGGGAFKFSDVFQVEAEQSVIICVI